MTDFKVGKITHYFDKIGVAVVEVENNITVGDNIKITGHDHEFTMPVGSMQVEHQQVTEAKKGETVGMKVDQPAKPGDEIYKVS